MAFGRKVAAALAEQAARKENECPNCGVPCGKKKTCSKRCQDAHWLRTHPAQVKKNNAASAEIQKQKRAEVGSILAAAETASQEGKKASKHTASLIKRAASKPVTASDLAPPSQEDMRAHIQNKFGAGGERLLDKLEHIAFHMKSVPAKVRIDAVKELLDRGFGKTAQTVSVAAITPIFAVPDAGNAMLPDLGNDDPPALPPAELPVIDIEPVSPIPEVTDFEPST